MPRPRRQTHLGEEPLGPAPPLAPRHPRQRQGQLNVFASGQHVQQPEVLEHEADPGAPEAREVAAAKRRDVLATDADAALLDGLEAAQDRQQRALAGAGDAGHRRVAAGRHLHVHVAEDRQRAGARTVTVRQTPHADHRPTLPRTGGPDPTDCRGVTFR